MSIMVNLLSPSVSRCFTNSAFSVFWRSTAVPLDCIEATCGPCQWIDNNWIVALWLIKQARGGLPHDSPMLLFLCVCVRRYRLYLCWRSKLLFTTLYTLYNILRYHLAILFPDGILAGFRETLFNCAIGTAILDIALRLTVRKQNGLPRIHCSLPC